MATRELDFDDRRLCPDEACIGLIGPDGKCKVCGRPEPGPPRPPPAWASDDEDDEDEGQGQDDEDDDQGPDEEDAEASDEDLAEAASLTGTERADGEGGAESDAFSDDRKLCPDGACIGLLGPDGRCKVCGKSAA